MDGKHVSPVEALAAEFQQAVKQLGAVEARRNKALSEWADLRELLRKGDTFPGLLHKFELAVALVHELNTALGEAQRKVRRLDSEMGSAQNRWSWERHMKFSRS